MFENRLNRLKSLSFIVALLYTTAVIAQPIPHRPEQLQYPAEKTISIKAKDYEQTVDGAHVFFKRNSETPLIRVTLYFPFGKVNEPENKPGLVNVFSHMLVHSGAGEYTADALEHQLADISANISMHSDRLYSTLSFTVPHSELDKGINLLHTILMKPKFEEGRLQLQQRQQLQAIESRYDNLNSIVQLNFRRLVYGNDFFINRLPSKVSIQSITQQNLQDAYHKWIHPQGASIAIDGNISKKKALTLVKNIFSGVNPSVKADEVDHFNVSRQSSGTYLLNRKGESSAVLVIGLPGVNRDNPDYYPLKVMNEVLGGASMTSRLFKVLREDHGLVYSVYSSVDAHRYASPFVIYLSTAPSKVNQVLTLLTNTINHMRNNLVTQDDLLIAKYSLKAKLFQSFSSNASTLDHFALDSVLQKPAIDTTLVTQKIRTVTLAQVNKMAKKYLDLHHAIVLIAGDTHAMHLSNHGQSFLPGLPVSAIDKMGKTKKLT
jgi:zinc protease